MTAARGWHLVTALLATGAVLLQTGLVLAGQGVLADVEPPAMWVRLTRLFTYFTILSNLLVAYGAWTLALGRDRDSRLWRVLRLDALIGITVTGLVHYVMLRPLFHPEGLDWVADRALHVAVPLAAVLGWLACGPRGRVRGADVWWALLPPVGWLVVVFLRGAVTGFYPYPFLDVGANGVGPVAGVVAGIAILFVLLALGVRWLDRRLPARDPGHLDVVR